MQHVRKMILVPHDSEAKIHDRPASASPVQSMSKLDTEMQRIMQQQYANDDEKWKNYNEALQKYLFFANESKQPLKIEMITEKSGEETQPKDKDKKDSDPIRSLLFSANPKTFHDQAGKIYDYLSSDSNITWDAQGTVSVHGRPIPHSNVVDLISNMTRHRKNFTPVGVTEFTKALSSLNIPFEMIGNDKLRTSILDLKLEEKPRKIKRRSVDQHGRGWTSW